MADLETISVLVQAGRIDVGEEARGLLPGGDAGAVVTFSGYCRDEGGRLRALEIEHYPGMAERAIRRIAEEAVGRWPLLRLRCIHRYGMIRSSEEIVFVACASVHRQAAFEAASFVMDFMKSKAPFWKREHLVDGTTGGWVEAKDTDDLAADRWHRL